MKVLQTKDVEGGQMRGLKKLTEREREMEREQPSEDRHM